MAGLRDLQFQDPNWLYEASHSEPLVFQGDIFENASVAYLDRTENAHIIDGPAMILSHGCDAVPGQSQLVTLAPIFDLDRFGQEVGGEDGGESRVETLRGNRFTGLMYLPAVLDREERYVDFHYAASVSVHLVEQWNERAVTDGFLRLTRRGWLLMTGKLAHHFARLERIDDYART